MSVHTVNIHGIPLVYEKEGSGPPIVFLHGGNASAVQWEHIVPHVMDAFTCFVLEQRGHGRSGRASDGDYRMSSLTDECVGFLDACAGRAILVGQSQGGGVAMGTAAQRPDLVEAIFLEDSLPPIYSQRRMNGAPNLKWFAALESVAQAKVRDGLSVAQHAYNIGQISPFGRRPIDVWPPEQLIFYARHAHGTDPAWYALVGSGRSAWPDEICDAIPGKVTCPVHLAHGDPATGSVVLPQDIDLMKSAGLNLTATRFTGAGHDIGRPFAREYINDLRAFLARVS